VLGIGGSVEAEGKDKENGFDDVGDVLTNDLSE
jgi:hypothetical protein